MVNKLFKEKFPVLLFCLLIVLSCSQCSRKDCYELQFQLSQDSSLTKGSPVIFDNGIVSYVEEVGKSNGNSVAEFCLPKAVQIPKNSKIYVGFIKAFRVYGIKIEPSNELGFISSKELLKGIPMDSINVNFAASDTVLINKLIDIVKDIIENHKNKRDSISKE
jgi:hypothetical protein